jgi:thiamine biosynthesis lipoprotein
MNELRFRAMGSDCQVIVVGGPDGLAEAGHRRVGELEQRWSRFRPDSEISLLNAAAGTAMDVGDDTVALVTRAVEGWRFTGGSYDPTVLGAVLRAGYDRSFEQLVDDMPRAGSALVVACTDIEIDGNRITVPRGTGIDPGGIGKGLAADLVAHELVDAGAVGACVNMGGDVAVYGSGPDDDGPNAGGWTVAVEYPFLDDPLVLLGVADSGVATSSTLHHRWTLDGAHRHHLIDPRTGEPADTDLVHVTVVAGSAWAAEVLAKAVLIRGADHPFDLVDGTGAEALVVTADGRVLTSAGFGRFGDLARLPAAVPVASNPTL